MSQERSPATLSADMIRRAVEILKQPPSAPLDQVVVPRGLWEQIISRFETAQKEPQSFVNMRIAYRGFSYGMGSEHGIDSLRRAINERGDY